VRQRAEVQQVKRDRDQARARNTLESVRRAAENGDNLMPPLIEAVASLCTVGEISDVYRETFGVYRDPAWI
jgi:methylmalonyl-CoA mutase N-terminal domain/subunit